MPLRYYTRDGDSLELEYVGAIAPDGEIIDGDEDRMELISEDMKRIREGAEQHEDMSEREIIDSLMHLHTGHYYTLVDDRTVDEMTEEEIEQVKNEEAEDKIEQSLRDAEIEFGVQKEGVAKRLLASHDDPFPIDAVLLAAKQARSPEWVTKMKAECETSADQRRYIAQSDAIVPVINLLLTGDDPYAGLR